MKIINLTTLILICLISFTLLFGDSDFEKTDSNLQTQPQTLPNKKTGWQIYEIDYPKTPPKRRKAGTVFDGDLFHVFSGSVSSESEPERDLWTYNPETDTWNEEELPDFVIPRLNARMFAREYEVLIYGGYKVVDGEVVPVCDGYTYFAGNRVSSWEKISTMNAPSPRTGYSTVFTGTEMIVFGGYSKSDGVKRDCYIYNLDDDKWRKVEVPEEVKGRYGQTTLWTGKYMLITGGITHNNVVMKQRTTHESVYDDSGNFTGFSIKTYNEPVEYPVATKQAVLYDPEKDKWKTFDMNTSRVGHTSVWTGKHALIWGGYTTDGENEEWCHNIERVEIENNLKHATSYSYSSSNNKIPARVSHFAYWTGHEMVIGFGDEGGGDGESVMYRSGGIYDPKYNNWSIPRNYPFTIFADNYKNQNFCKGSTIYNFSDYEDSLTGRYLADRDIFLPYLGTGNQPKSAGLQLIDTPQGIFASEYNVYMNWRIMTQAFWKFNENTGKFERIDSNRKDVQYGQLQMLYRNNKIYNHTTRYNYDLFSVKQGFMGIYNPKNNSWISAQTNGNIPVDRRLSANYIGEENIFVFSGIFTSETQYSEVADVDWKERLPGGEKASYCWQLPWFDEQRKIARQSKTYPVLKDGYLYNFKQNRWKNISLKNAPCPRIEALCCELNGKFAVFGGMSRDFRTYFNREYLWDDDKTQKLYEKISLFDGGIYDPKTNTWQYIRDLNTYDIPYSEYTYKSLKLSPIGSNLILHGETDRNIWRDDKEKKEGEFFAFIYDIAQKQWIKIEKPDVKAEKIAEVLNVKDKTICKIKFYDEDDERIYYKWYIFDYDMKKWTECSLNDFVERDFKGKTDFMDMDDTEKNILLRIFKDKLFFYTYTPKTSENEDSENSNPRSIVRIYSYNPETNSTKELTNIELNAGYVSDGFVPWYKYWRDYRSYRQHNSSYSRDRMVLFGINSSTKTASHYPGRFSKMYMLVYNFPDE